jgi:hypothetical protein
MFSWVGCWINDRWPLEALIRLGLEEEIIGGTSYAYIWGIPFAELVVDSFV